MGELLRLLGANDVKVRWMGAAVAVFAVAGCDEQAVVDTFGDAPSTVAVSARALGEELVVNGDFSNGANQWYLGQWGGSSSGSVSAGRYRIAVTAAGGEWWNVQLLQGGLPLEQGKRYVFAFDAYKGPENGGAQSMVVNVGEDGGDYTSYFDGYGPEVPLTTATTHHSFAFEMTEPDDPAARVEFNCGRNTGTVYIDNVSLAEETEDESRLSISAAAHAFGNVLIGDADTVTLVLTNNGDLPTTVTAVTADGAVFSVGGPLAFVVAPNSSAAVAVSFAPTDPGPVSGMLTIQSDAVDHPVLTVPLTGTGIVPGQGYQPESPYLVNPDLAIPFVEDIAAFRLRARDDANGGFYTFIDRQGNPTGENTKSLCAQSRLGYAFTRAFALTGDEAYLDHAHHALKFLYDHGWRNGWRFATDIQGNDISHWGHDNWWSFQQHYALVGIAAMVEVTGGYTDWGDGSASDWYWLQTGVDSNYNRLWDANPATAGYFDRATTNWSSRWGKGFTPTVDAMTTHSLLLALMTLLLNPPPIKL